ncbi:MAG: PHP domain-containing protein, partial [Candidatus Eisenbacteria bacterium]|nr:PHP domain-containing protein [Candidatus Eisenbacteria bacterium]
PGGRRVDLHAHTTFSDGLLSPEALVARAVDKRLAALAVTDHDTVEAIPRARAAAGAAIELVPGIEMSTAFEGADLHILGFFVSAEHAPLVERLARFQRERHDRALAIVERLRSLGAPVELDTVLELAGPGVVGRPHVAEALIRAGLAADFDDAFGRFLGAQAPAYVPRPAFRPDEAIALIHAADGVSVLAHPGPQMTDGVIERLRDAGLRGIEVWHPSHGASAVRRYRVLADRLALLATGGSDFHGEHRSWDLGELPVPFAVLDALKQAAGVTG